MCDIQRHATKFILNDYSSDYKSRLITLNLFFVIKYFKYPPDNFNLSHFVSFARKSTRSITCMVKLL